MAAVDVLGDVRRSLQAHRRQGDSFDRAWTWALASVGNQPIPASEYAHWTVALEATCEAWRAAYDSRPPSAPAAALADLAAA